MNKLSKELPTKPGADSPQAGLSQRYLAFVGEFNAASFVAGKRRILV